MLEYVVPGADRHSGNGNLYEAALSNRRTRRI